MSNSSTFAEFIGKKVNKVRWKPEDLMASTVFVTGSWDNLDVITLSHYKLCKNILFILYVLQDNVLELWGLTSEDENTAKDFPPKLLDSVQQDGNVTQIRVTIIYITIIQVYYILFLYFQFIDNRYFAASTDSGTVRLYRVINENEASDIHLKETENWEKIHSFGYDCTVI